MGPSTTQAQESQKIIDPLARPTTTTANTECLCTYSPFEDYQTESGIDESKSWKTSNKTAYKDEQPKLNLKARPKKTTIVVLCSRVINSPRPLSVNEASQYH
jgi:hypothetical protein